MKNKSFGMGRIIYTEWLYLLRDYYTSLRFNIVVYEIIVPVLVASGCTILYSFNNLCYGALKALGTILPASVSILIGFSIMFITILITSQNANIERLKDEKKKNGHGFTLYQQLLSQFAYSLTAEILLLIVVLAFLFLSPFIKANIITLGVFLFSQVFLTLHILLIILREMANVYFVCFKPNGNDKK